MKKKEKREKMPELLYENLWEHIYSLFLDVIIFFVKSVYFIAESIYLTLLPDKFREKKVSIGIQFNELGDVKQL